MRSVVGGELRRLFNPPLNLCLGRHVMGDFLGVVDLVKLGVQVICFAVLKLLARIHAALFQQVCHLGAHALEPHQVGAVGPFGHLGAVYTQVLEQFVAFVRVFGVLQQMFVVGDALFLKLGMGFWMQALDFGNFAFHVNPLVVTMAYATSTP